MKIDEFFTPKLINLFCNSRLKYNNIKQEKDESAVYPDDKYKHTEKAHLIHETLCEYFEFASANRKLNRFLDAVSIQILTGTYKSTLSRVFASKRYLN